MVASCQPITYGEPYITNEYTRIAAKVKTGVISTTMDLKVQMTTEHNFVIYNN
jgi:hypothetical protein